MTTDHRTLHHIERRSKELTDATGQPGAVHYDVYEDWGSFRDPPRRCILVDLPVFEQWVEEMNRLRTQEKPEGMSR